jgi:hypothetical protein
MDMTSQDVALDDIALAVSCGCGRDWTSSRGRCRRG